VIGTPNGDATPTELPESSEDMSTPGALAPSMDPEVIEVGEASGS
jgi:hypothetical protein